MPHTDCWPLWGQNPMQLAIWRQDNKRIWWHPEDHRFWNDWWSVDGNHYYKKLFTQYSVCSDKRRCVCFITVISSWFPLFGVAHSCSFILTILLTMLHTSSGCLVGVREESLGDIPDMDLGHALHEHVNEKLTVRRSPCNQSILYMRHFDFCCS